MKICLVHNAYGKVSGEEIVVNGIVDLLRSKRVDVVTFFRSSEELEKKIAAKAQAFLSGIYNPFSRRCFRALLERELPDVVHIHNLFPLISPTILPVCSSLGVPVVMTVHNYRLVCPNGLFAVDGKVCERCSGGKEYWCVLRNCEGSLFKSLGYALRTFTARTSGAYKDNVSMYAVLTEFQREKLVNNGYQAERIAVVPNMVETSTSDGEDGLGEYVGFVGRVSPEKRVDIFVEAARRCPDISFRVAGDYSQARSLVAIAPGNVLFDGMLSRSEMDAFYRSSRMIIMMNTWYEGFPMALVEAMSWGKPVICSRIGGLPEIVEEGVTGLLFEPGNVDQLADQIRYLWENPDVAIRMGQAGCDKAKREYSREKYFERLMDVYKKAMRM